LKIKRKEVKRIWKLKEYGLVEVGFIRGKKSKKK